MLIVGMLMLVQAAAAQPGGGDPAHELHVDMHREATFLSAADRDGDGALSLPEYEAEMDHRLDAAIAANPAAQKKITAEKRAAIREKMLAPSFRSFDKNSDGRLTTAEMPGLASTSTPDAK